MFLLRRSERFAFTSRLWQLAAALFAVMVFKTGIWAYPSQDMFLWIARDPFVNPATHPNDHDVLWCWLGPLELDDFEWTKSSGSNVLFYRSCLSV